MLLDKPATKTKYVSRTDLVAQDAKNGYRLEMQVQSSIENKTLALKRIKSTKEGVAPSTLLEIQSLQRCSSDNILTLFEVCSVQSKDVAMIFKYFDHDCFGIARRGVRWSMIENKFLTQQLFKGLADLHRARIAHRDLKTSNILLSNRGEIQIADLGLSTDALSYDRQFPNTLLYRAPELLFKSQQSPSYLQDLWALGCVFVELLTGTPLFARVKSQAQLKSILAEVFKKDFKETDQFLEEVEGQSSYEAKEIQQTLYNLDSTALDLVKKLLQVDPFKRISVEDALNHSFFQDVYKPQSLLDKLEKVGKNSHEFSVRREFLRKKKIQKQLRKKIDNDMEHQSQICNRKLKHFSKDFQIRKNLESQDTQIQFSKQKNQKKNN